MELNKGAFFIISIILPVIIFSPIYIPFYLSGEVFVIGGPKIMNVLAPLAGLFLIYDSFLDLKLRKKLSFTVIKTLIGASILFIHLLAIYFGYIR